MLNGQFSEAGETVTAILVAIADGCRCSTFEEIEAAIAGGVTFIRLSCKVVSSFTLSRVRTPFNWGPLSALGSGSGFEGGDGGGGGGLGAGATDGEGGGGADMQGASTTGSAV